MSQMCSSFHRYLPLSFLFSPKFFAIISMETSSCERDSIQPDIWMIKISILSGLNAIACATRC